MKRTIIFLSPIIVGLILCFTGYSASGLYTGDAEKRISDSTKKNPPVDLSNIKKLQPFSVEGGILIPSYGLPSEEQLQAAASKKETSSSAKNETRWPRYKEGEVLVKFKKGVTASSAKSKAASLNMTVEKEFSVLSQIKGQTYVLVKSKTQNTIDLIAQFKNDPSVETATPNYERRISATTPNDPLFSYLWGLNNTGQDIGCGAGTPDADIDAPEAWDINTGSSGVVVADIDTGVDYTHVDLASNMWHNPGEVAGNGIDDDGNGYIDDVYGIDAYNYDSDPMDDHGHGTHTSGTMAAAGNNNIGVTGVGWNTKIMALKFLSAGGGGYDADAITCIEYIIGEKLYHNVNVVAINASWGGYGYDQALRDAIEEAGNAGILFCAAAGNDTNNNDGSNPHYPSSYDVPNIIAVAASDNNDQLTSWSNYGATSVDLAAPGGGRTL